MRYLFAFWMLLKIGGAFAQSDSSGTIDYFAQAQSLHLEYRNQPSAELAKRMFALSEAAKGGLGSVDSLQATLIAQNRVLIEFMTSDTGIFCFALDGRQIQVFYQPMPEGWAQRLAAYQTALQASNLLETNPVQAYNQLTEHGFWLYERLLLPARGALTAPAWIIVPDEALEALPFEALLEESLPPLPAGSSPDFAALPYLLKTKTIHYAASAYFYARQAQANPDRARGGLMCVATAGIAAAQREAEALKKTYGGLLLVGATETRYRQWCADFSILHLAVRLDSAGIALSNAADSLHDGVLSTPELAKLPLNAALVVVDPRESAIFPRSVAQTLLRAGTAAVVVGLWPSDEASSRAIWARFYRELANGIEQPEALRIAKLAWLESTSRNPAQAHPRFWASFVQIGQPSSKLIRLGSDPQQWYFMIATVGFGVLMIGWMWLRRKKHKAVKRRRRRKQD